MNLFRTRGIAATASLCVATTAMLSLLGVEPAQAMSPTQPTEAALGFNVFVLGNAALTSNETEGPVALGGNLTIGGNYQVAGNQVGTFTVGTDARPSALVVGGQVNLAGSDAASRLSVLSDGYVKVGDLTGVDVRNIDDNNTMNVDTRIVRDGALYNSTPRVDLTISQPVASVGPASPIDFAAAFTEFRTDSSTLGRCTENVTLTDAANVPLPDTFPAGTQAYITLTDGVTNVLNISAELLNNLAGLTFRNQPNEDRPLLVNVGTTAVMNNFAWTVANQAGLSSAAYPYMLWNFPTALNILMQPNSATLEGTLYAPNATLTDRSPNNIEGQVIVSGLVHGDARNNGGEMHPFPFEGILSCAGPVTPTFFTRASPDVTLGGTVFDTATLDEAASPTGTITFRLYGPDNAECTGMPVFDYTVEVDHGNGEYPSPTFTPTAVGTYRWTAEYSGDANNNELFSPCDAENESVVVNPRATTTLSTQASPTVPVGGTVTDTATLAGGQDPTGTITFRLYGPNDADCTGTTVFSDDVTVDNGNADYTSEAYTPVVAGLYRWTAVYSGDANNLGATSSCNAANETVLITPQGSLSLVTDASDDITIGGTVTDTATLDGGQNPTGIITFRLYGPNDATCTGMPVFTDEVVVVSGTRTYTSDPYEPLAPGTYRWTAGYGGDTNNDPAASPCNAANESVVVNPRGGPSIVTNASDDITLGGTVTDTAALTGGQNPTGTITFELFGPDNETCTGRPVFTDEVDLVPGTTRYTSAAFEPTAPGTYRWVATYSGDANNDEAVSPCNAENESVVVRPAAGPSLVTRASDDVKLGGEVFDRASLTGAQSETGTITFQLYGPGDRRCERRPVFTSTVDVSGDGRYRSESFRPERPGTYQWVATYTGANGETASTECGDRDEQVEVKKKYYGGRPRP
ncbi:hypothetical protein CS0771_42950 [Catellatospora sp. IY07-71]|uniref:collagen-binding domain-containing protein n=1 Tax=Catellatospora sp. IY07-71 TaxID=2728827 RepID=UPI001BB460DE|nr:collagen-binding domain-containing protein [Catellatospora sp. IY07-71]BCJ74751.1 hypothetical protein CS0771_42950 [Catellatospora sp. IY07-71]